MESICELEYSAVKTEVELQDLEDLFKVLEKGQAPMVRYSHDHDEMKNRAIDELLATINLAKQYLKRILGEVNSREA